MTEPLFWSDRMDRVFRDAVVDAVREHPETDFTENLLLGFPFDLVRSEIIAKGLADFGTGYTHPEYGTLTAAEKVLLYCFINFKAHFFACRATYDCHRDELARWLGGEAPVVVDLGCGPGTAGLALCDAHPGSGWDYVGVDTSAAMRALATRLLAAAQAAGVCQTGRAVRLCDSWASCGPDVVPPTAPLLVVCSYLFASRSLNTAVLRDLADWVRGACLAADRPVALLVYLNSTNPYANTNYEYFKTLIRLDPLAHQPTPATVYFRKNRYGKAVGKDDFLHELLILKGG